METALADGMGIADKRLETFLVEWKQSRIQRIKEAVEGLETFLVEWKQGKNLRKLLALLHLETFLVEWKHAAIQTLIGKLGALKPS